MSTPQETVDRALALSRTDGCVVIADEASGANLRWANNTLTTNGVTRSRQLTVIAISGPRAAVVSRSGVTDDDLESVVREAEHAAETSPPAEDAQPLLDGGSLAWEDGPEETSPAVFAAVAQDLGQAFADGRRQLFGYADHGIVTTYVGTSTGGRWRHAQPTGHLEINAKSPANGGSVWAGLPTADFTDLSVGALDRELQARLRWHDRVIDLPAGRYETVLPPTAVADLLICLYWAAGGRDAHDGRSVFSHHPIGDRVAELPLTLRSDPAGPGLECAPFAIVHASSDMDSVFDNGLGLGPTRWIDEGRVAALIQTRHSAGLTGQTVTPGIDNLILDGPDGGRTLATMIEGTERGLLLTCLWYIRTVDPITLLQTGLTRDGVYLLEHGEVVGAVNNFRFNESPLDLLTRTAECGETERTLPREWADYFTRTAMPPLRVPDFNMSSVSQAS
jgi:predicted Zn-dependent protease